MKKTIILIMCAIILGGGMLRLYGIEWGIPRPPYWRYHYQDEGFTLGLILRMAPDQLNPHYFINPTFHYYTLLFSAKLASATGYIQTSHLPARTNNLGQPLEGVSLPDYARMFYAGRIVSILQGILLILLVFLIGKNLYNAVAGTIAATLTAVLPTLVFQSHILVVDAPAVFWLAVAFWFLTTNVWRTRKSAWHIVAGILVGIAIGTKYTNVLIMLPFFYASYITNRKSTKTLLGNILNQNTLIACGTAIVVFCLTSPHVVLSFNEFLYGDVDGFGGILGERGLFAYNRYGFNLLSPFTVSTFHSLRLPLLLATTLGVGYLFYRRRSSDILLLTYVVPFYVLLIVNASPHLRHFLPVLPFLMLATGRLLADMIMHKKHPVVRYAGIVIMIIAVIHPLAFSLAYVKRMDAYDTRIQCADWIRKNMTDKSIVGIATFYPFNYTPPFEVFTRRIVVTDYDYDRLLKKKPHFFVITQFEYEEFHHTKRTPRSCRRFIEKLFAEKHYHLAKVFRKDFEIVGIDVQPHFPLSWNPVSPTIYVFVLKS